MRLVIDLGGAGTSARGRARLALARALVLAAGDRLDLRVTGDVDVSADETLADPLPPTGFSAYRTARSGIEPDAARRLDRIVRNLHVATLEPHVVLSVPDGDDPALFTVRSPPRSVRADGSGGGDVLGLVVASQDAGEDAGDDAGDDAGEPDGRSARHDVPAEATVAVSPDAPDAGARVLALVERLAGRGGPHPSRRPVPGFSMSDAIDAIGQVIGRVIGRSGADDAAIASAVAPALDAAIEAGRPGEELGPPRLLVDVTQTHRTDMATGIQRLVRRTVEALAARSERKVVPVVLQRGALVAVPGPDRSAPLGEAVSWRTGDVLLMLDSSWGRYGEFAAHFQAARAVGGAVHTVVYDLTPLVMPDAVDGKLIAPFDAWFRAAARESDGLICISRTVAGEVARYIRERRIPHRDGLRIGSWPLGSDNLSLEQASSPSPALREWFAGDAPTFLMVGTIEPRKRHDLALDAIEALWAGGSPARLLLAGRRGWSTAGLVERIREHPEAGRRLTWLDGASDADIAHAYAHASALVFPSAYEGFGFPIVEAARAGLPVIASDIAVHREVGGEGVAYFATGDAGALADAMRGLIDGSVRPDPARVRTRTWLDSADALLDTIYGWQWHETLRA